jgi:phosphoribosylanthranilate isomerase
MTRFKICGLRESAHAVVAAESGADFLGFNFVPGVRRQVAVDEARRIIGEYRHVRGEGGPGLVGLFADQPIDEVNRIVGSCRLDFAQLCGDEPSEYWGRVEVPVIRQIKVPGGAAGDVTREIEERVEEALSRGYTPLLDRREAGHLGGTGRSFDWRVARDIAADHRIVLAGGLTPENVAEAVRTVGPWGVDVSSGVETAGVKDLDKIRAFAEQVRAADRELAEESPNEPS